MKKLLVISLLLIVSCAIAADNANDAAIQSLFKRHENAVKIFGIEMAKANRTYEDSVKLPARIRDSAIDMAKKKATRDLKEIVAVAERLNADSVAKVAKADLDKISSGDASDMASATPEVNIKVPKKKCHGYMVVYGSFTWDQAKKACEEMGGRLVVIETQEEMDLISKLTKQERFWVGCRKQGEKYLWMNGKEVDDNLWGTTNPNNPSSVLPGQDCGCTSALSPKIGLHDVDPKKFVDVFGFICEWEKE